MKKLFATLLTLVLLIAGIYYLAPEANEVKAADTTAKNYIAVEKDSDEYTEVDGVPTKEGYLFAGYFKSEDCKIATRSREKDANYVKFVRKEVMDVKVQVTNGVVSKSENEKYVGKYVIRFTSSVDGLNYRNIGFELEYADGRTVRHTTTKVFKSIESTVGTVDGKADTYEFSPNLLSTDSQYFMTVKLPVATNDVDEEYTVRAFWTTLDGTEVFGQERTVSVNDGNGDIVNLPVSKALDKEKPYAVTYTNASGEEKTGKVEVLSDYTARITLAEGDKAVKLKSVTKFTITTTGEDAIEVLYRNYYRSHEPEDGSTTPVADTSWYEMYPNATEYTIASSADLYGLAKLVNDKTELFTGKTVNLVKDVTVNKGRVKRYRETGSEPAWVADSGETTYNWTPIGVSDVIWFNGTFDGHGHEISGIYLSATSGKNGFFGYTGSSSVLQNFKLTNSYVKSTATLVGCVVGASYTLKYENIYTDASLHYTKGYAGGIIGYNFVVSGKQQVLNNCWFDGEIYQGGGNCTSAFVGYFHGAVNMKMTNCLFTGDVVGKSSGVHDGGNYGTILGYANTTGTKLEVENCMIAGRVNLSGASGQGVVLGTQGGQNYLSGSMTNVYIISEPTNTTVPLQGTTTAITTNNVERVEISSLTSLSQEALLEKFPLLEGEEQAVWVCAEGETPILKTFASWYNGREKAIAPDISWYTAASATKKYTITTAEELYGFAELSQTKDFTGWEITLGKDIELNKIEEGTVESWKNGAVPVNTWTPIGTSGTTMPFKGTFDGQGHTISGLYLNTATGNGGMFARTNGAVIKDFKLVDSYMRTTNNNLGLIGYVAGDLTLQNVYSDAVVVVSGSGTKTSGKLFGRIEGGGTVSIEGCWSDGELIIDGGGNYVAGFIGYFNMAAGGNFTLRNCLNSADIVSTTGNSNYLGGFIGSTGNTAVTITMTDCLDVGSIKKVGSTVTQVGSFIGFNNESSATWNGVVKGDKDADCRVYTIGNAYYDDKSVGKTIGDSRTNYATTQFLTSRTTLLATTEAELETLFGEGQTAWECDSVSNNTDRGTPILSHINKDNWWSNRQTVTDVKIQADTSWYEEASANGKYEIKTAAELYGLAELSQTKDFYGWEITLGADIELNYVDEDTVAAWENGAEPLNKWTPIGTSSTTMPFKGTFDGKGHTISGLYMNTSTRYNGMFARVDGAVIKNFKLVDSYMRTTSREFGLVGYVTNNLTLQNVYSDAVLVVSGSSTKTTGKIVGYIAGNGTTTIEGCWSDGKIIIDGGGNYVAGLIGYFDMGAGGNFTLRNCLNSADIVSTTGDSNYLGGFIGSTGNATVNITMTDCLDVGSIRKAGTTVTQVGSFIGFNNESSATWNGVVAGDKDADCRVYTIGNAYYNDALVGKTIGNPGKANYATTQFLTSRTTLLATTEAELNTLFGSNQTAWECDSVRNSTNRGTPILAYFNEDNWWANRQNDVNLVITPDTSWYDSRSDKFLLTTAEQLYGLAELSQRYNFDGQVIKLGADIALNNVGADTVEAWKDGEVAFNTWTPIGTTTTAKPFKGTFDGQGHTISGLYMNTSTQYNGMFARVDGAVIKNFKLVDSYMRTTSREFGLVGYVTNNLTLQNVYSDAVLVVSGSGTKTTGKIVGYIAGNGTTTIEGCWSDGKIIIDGGGNYVAGLIGYFDMGAGGNFTLRNCLNSADIVSTTGDSNYLGGFIGSTGNAAVNITMTDCLDVGSVKKVGTTVTQVGSFIGFNSESSATWNGVVAGDKDADCRVYTIGNAYYNDALVGKTIGNPGKTNYATTQFLTDRATLLATTEAELEVLFGEGQTAWACDTAIDGVKRGTPILATFADWWIERAPEAVEGYIAPDTSWYEEAEANGTYEIETAEEMYGFALLAKQHNFAGITITLGNDIELNVVEEGTVKDWQEKGTRPVNTWMPIGTSDMQFAGTFDGKGNTISGLYLNVGTTTPAGMFGSTTGTAVVKNFNLVDSYMKSTGGWLGIVGSGTVKSIENVYTNAVIKSDTGRVGGMLGQFVPASSTTVGTFSNCWFDGVLTSGGDVAGGIVGHIKGLSTLEFNNCLNTGSVSCSGRAGGILGYIENGWWVSGEGWKTDKWVFNNCLNVGQIQTTGSTTDVSVVGGIVGSISTNAISLTLNNTYTTGTATCGYYYTSTTADTKTKLESDSVLKSREEIVNIGKVILFPESTEWVDDIVYNDTDRGTPILAFYAEDWFERNPATGLTERISWYSDEAPEFTLTTANQLYSLSYIAKYRTFEGKTVKLGKDIALNAVDETILSNWQGGSANGKNWIPIGTASKPFEGTFDGQGKTISGLFLNTSTSATGLFGTTGAKAQIKDFRLVDSYIKSTNDNVGLIGTGTFERIEDVYTNAIMHVQGSNVGGFIGNAYGSGTDMYISNCWFDGTIIQTWGADIDKDDYGAVAGFVGMTTQSSEKLRPNFMVNDCLNTGSVAGYNHVGGFIGRHAFGDKNEGVSSTWANCLMVGSVSAGKTAEEGNVFVAMFIGNYDTSGKTNFTASYAADGTPIQGASSGNATCNEDAVTSRAALYKANVETLFPESNKWVADEGWNEINRGTPILAYFEELWLARQEDVDAEYEPSTEWYTNPETDGEYIIQNKGDMLGFLSLSNNGENFEGETIKLGANITLNEPDVEAWAAGKAAPTTKWTPIGSASNPFAGTFDGQGHTIRGLYANSSVGPMGLFGVTAVGSEIKDFRIVDSYFKLTNTSEVAIGSAVGKLGGNMSNVYSNATIRHDYSRTGGLVGEVLSKDGSVIGEGSLPVSIENCWFDGKIVGGATEYARRVGGIVGKLHYGKLTMKNVLFTGTIDSDVTHNLAYIGGLVGVTQEENKGLELKIENAISAGKITGNFKSSTNVGSIVGGLLGSYKSVAGEDGLPKYSFTNVFATRDCYNIPYATHYYGNGTESTTSVIEGTVVMSSGNDRLLGYIPQGINGANFNASITEETILGKELTIEAPYTGLVEKQIAQLDFTSAEGWTIRAEGVPVLKCFADLVDVVSADTTALAGEVGLDIDLKTNAVPKGAGNYVVTYDIDEKATITYAGYCEQLRTLGFKEEINNNGTSMSADGVYSATFVKEATGTSGEWVINVTYVDHEVVEKRGTYSYDISWNSWTGNDDDIKAKTLDGKKLYISISTDTSSLSPNLKAENVTNEGENAVTLSMLEDPTGKATDGSNAFVFQLPNGHFIINDGAYDAKTLITYLRNLVEEGEPVVIDAWTITHFHDDHVAAIAELRNDAALRENVYVEGVYVSEPSTYGVNSWTSYNAYKYSNEVMQAFGMMSTQNGDEVPVYQVHMGQRYYFNGVTMDVVDTQEQHLEEYWNSYVTNSSMFLPDPSNTSSTQFIFTVQNGEGVADDKKVLLGGDATLVNMEYVMQAYGEDPNTFANINVFAAYHHGKNNTCVWNSEQSKREATTTWMDYMLNNEKNANGSDHKFDVVFFARHTLFEATEGGAYPDNTDDINQILIGKTNKYYTWSYGDSTGATSDNKHGSVMIELGATVKEAAVYEPWNKNDIINSTLKEYGK